MGFLYNFFLKEKSGRLQLIPLQIVYEISADSVPSFALVCEALKCHLRGEIISTSSFRGSIKASENGASVLGAVSGAGASPVSCVLPK